MSIVATGSQPLSRKTHNTNHSFTYDTLKNLSLTVRTSLDANTFFTTVLPPSIRNGVFLVQDEAYPHKPQVEEHRHFIICSNQQTFDRVLSDLRSKGLLVTTGIRSPYWPSVATKLEKGEVYTEGQSLSSLSHEVGIVRGHPERKTIRAYSQVDVVSTIMSTYPQRFSIPSLNATTPAADLHPSTMVSVDLGPTGEPSCLATILTHDEPWTRQAAHRAYKLASQEVKSLMGKFRLKHQALADKAKYDFMINLTLEGAMEIINGIQDEDEKKIWILRNIRERRKFDKDGKAMLSEYYALMSHCRRLQKACIDAANEAYNVKIVIRPANPLLTPAPPSTPSS